MKLKIFYKKDFQGVLKEKEELQCAYDELHKKVSNKEYKYFAEYNTYRDRAEQLEKVNEEHLKLNGELRKENDDLKETIKELRGAKGGLTKQVNKLTKELDEAKALIKEQKKELSKRYILKKVRGTMPEKQEMQLYSKQKTSGIIKKVKEQL